MSSKEAKRAKCYTFYSYKGGSGRSTTCVNTVLHLVRAMNADPEHPILLVDADLESAGLTYFFDCEKKFSTLSVNATMLLRQNTAVMEEDNAAWVLGDMDAYAPMSVSPDVITDLQKAGVEDAAQLFEGICVYPPERNLLNIIVASYLKKRAAARETTGLLQGIQKKALLRRSAMCADDERISRIYDLDALLGKLRALTKKPGTAEERAQEKRAALLDFLPTTKFADISNYFNCEPGTVRFLGVVLNYQDEQIVRNDADAIIRSLLNLCGHSGYRAVVFDSSAGVQSTAHALHAVSDVIVYCMRPSTQFIKGTATQLDNYRESLLRHKADLQYQRSHDAEAPAAGDDKKPVILLPTAVPQNSTYQALREESFGSIRQNLLSKRNLELVDGAFCTPETALNEMELFKWREQILGVPEVRQMSAGSAKLAEEFSTEEGVLAHEDAAKAYRTYRVLAECMIKNS